MLKPDWLRVKAPQQERIGNVADLLVDLKLNTVCQEASCPNIGECFAGGTATFLIMGPACTRKCPYCDISFDNSKRLLDPSEPDRLGEAVYRMGLTHVVITSVNRDDLEDGGASQFLKCIKAVQSRSPFTSIEVLIPDLCGNWDALKVILDAADEMGETLSFTKAAVGGGALFPSLRQEYADRGIACLQCYATADLGNIAYESAAMEGMIVDEGVMVEIVTPGTGNLVPDGEVGEVLVTSFNADYPLIRFATGDLSAVMSGTSPCGRSNTRIKGWMGRADQTTKVRGMFVQPSQVNKILETLKIDGSARMIVSRSNDKDELLLKVEAEVTDTNQIESLQQKISDEIKNVINLRGNAKIVPINSLPNDGKVIDDIRDFGE